MKKWKIISIAVVTIFISGYIGAVIGYNTHSSEVMGQTSTEELSAAAIYNIVNEERQKAGVPALSFNDKLIASAQAKCADMVKNNYYEHKNPVTGKAGGEYVYEYLPTAKLASENLDQGTAASNRAVVDDWLNSPDHKAALLDPRWTDTGIAVCHTPSEPSNSHTIVEHFAF